jgi:DNA invertase Pin-like site-specific DNA recombinase
MAKVPRTFGYVCATGYGTIGDSASAQGRAIESRSRQLRWKLDGRFVDISASEDLALRDREAGGRLDSVLSRGDRVVVAKSDRLASSFAEFAHLLDAWTRRGISVHLCDMGCLIDPVDREAQALIRLILAFADFGSRVRGVRTRNGIAARKAAGQRHTHHAPWGYQWQHRGNKTIMVPVEYEQMIMRKAAELHDRGYSVDQIRQYLVYECRATNRKGRELGHDSVHRMVQRGKELLRSDADATKPNLVLVTALDAK